MDLLLLGFNKCTESSAHFYSSLRKKVIHIQSVVHTYHSNVEHTHSPKTEQKENLIIYFSICPCTDYAFEKEILFVDNVDLLDPYLTVNSFIPFYLL